MPYLDPVGNNAVYNKTWENQVGHDCLVMGVGGGLSPFSLLLQLEKFFWNTNILGRSGNLLEWNWKRKKKNNNNLKIKGNYWAFKETKIFYLFILLWEK